MTFHVSSFTYTSSRSTLPKVSLTLGGTCKSLGMTFHVSSFTYTSSRSTLPKVSLTLGGTCKSLGMTFHVSSFTYTSSRSTLPKVSLTLGGTCKSLGMTFHVSSFTYTSSRSTLPKLLDRPTLTEPPPLKLSGLLVFRTLAFWIEDFTLSRKLWGGEGKKGMRTQVRVACGYRV